MSPRGPSRAPKYRKPAFAKTLKNHWFFKVFGGPRPSKTASEDPRRLPRGYLGLLGAILSHLGAILKTRACKIAPAKNRCGGGPPSCSILGPILGPEIGAFLVILGVIFWISFGTLFGLLSGPFWGQFWDQIGTGRRKDGTKRASKSSKDPKSCICENLKNLSVF